MPDTPKLMIPLTQVVPRTLDWLWPNRLALGKLAMFDGDPGRGKSLVTLDLCARITTGQPMPDGTGADAPANVAIIQGEDFAADTVAPRLLALGADLGRVFIIDNESLQTHGPFTLPSCIATLEETLILHSPRLLIIDPVMTFLDRDVLSCSDQSVRRALAPLGQLAEKHRCAVILIRHLNKTASKRSIYRGGGSIGFNAICRTSWLFTDDPEDPSRCLLAQVKNNLASPQPTLAYRIERDTCAPPKLQWLGPTPLTADQLLLQTRHKSEGPPTHERACTFLTTLMEPGPQPTNVIWDAARPLGFAKRTLQRASKTLEIRSLRVWDGEQQLTWWLLPGQRLPDSIPPEHRPDDLDDLFAELEKKYPVDPLGTMNDVEDGE